MPERVFDRRAREILAREVRASLDRRRDRARDPGVRLGNARRYPDVERCDAGGASAHGKLAPSRDALTPTNATAPSEDSRAAPQGRSEAASLATETEAVQETAGTALIRVRAFAKESGTALVGRTIVARPHGASTWSTSTTKLSRAAVGEAPTTDEHGRAELAVSARTAHTLSFLERMSSAGVDVPALELGETYEVDLGLAMEADLTFVGRVIDAETRAPIAGVSVRPETDGRSGSTPSGDTAQSDESNT